MVRLLKVAGMGTTSKIEGVVHCRLGKRYLSSDKLLATCISVGIKKFPSKLTISQNRAALRFETTEKVSDPLRDS